MKNLMKLKAALIALMVAVLLAAGAAKTPARPELLEGPGWTTVNNNLHQMEGPKPAPVSAPAFRLYRSGAPSKETFAKWCGEYRIARVIVMSGDAATHELKYQKEGVCPGLKVIYNVTQDLTPLSDGFLKWFDEQVREAKSDQVGLLFRCQTGSHRAGRLAAYYQMKDQGLSADEAIAVMDHNGMMMPVFNPTLVPQVRALDDHIHGRPCGQKPSACVIVNSKKWAP